MFEAALGPMPEPGCGPTLELVPDPALEAALGPALGPLLEPTLEPAVLELAPVGGSWASPTGVPVEGAG